MLRIPGTINHKPAYRSPRVLLRRFDPSPLASFPSSSAEDIRAVSAYIVRDQLGFLLGLDLDRSPNATLRKYRRLVPPMARSLLANPRPFYADRSKAIYIIITGLFEAGASPEETAHIVLHSVYFRSKHGRNLNALGLEVQRALAKLEADRAEQAWI